MINRRWLAWFVLVCSVSQLTTAKDTLRLAQVLFRHGDRSAVQTYPNDKFGESIWPQGFGQLTMIGMRQHYSLGQFFRKKYTEENQLLNKNYTKNQIYIRSTDFERTLMSAESDLSGLFPPGPDQQWNDNPGKQWQPIPVHTRSIKKDKLLNVNRDTKCPRYKQLYDELMATKPYASMVGKNKDLVSLLMEKTGYTYSISNITGLYDEFFCMQQNNLTRYWPEWMNTTVLATLKEFQNLFIKVEHSVPEMCKLAGGPLLSEMIKNMKTRIKDEEDPRRMYMFSAHDRTVAAYLSVLRQLDPPINPPYISCVMVELYQKEDKTYYVQVYHRNDSTGQIPPYQLHIPGCDSTNCHFDNFVEATSGMRVDDLSAACVAHFQPTTNNIVITVVSSVFAVCIILSLSCCYLRRKKKRVYNEYLITGQGTNNYVDDEEEDEFK